MSLSRSVPRAAVISSLVLAGLIGAGGCAGNGATSVPPSGTGGAGTGGAIGSGGSASGGSKGTGGTVAGSGGDAADGGPGPDVGEGSGGRIATGGAAGTSSVPTGGVGGAATASGGASSASGGVGGSASGGAGQGGGGRGGASGRPGGAAGAATDPKAAASVLDGFALLKPCFSTPASCAGCTCDENPSNILNSGVAPENQHLTKDFGGEAGVIYNVKLRVVGVAERYWYAGGTLDPTSKVFYTGGLPTIHGAQAMNDNLGAGKGACKIHPPQTDGSPYNFPLPFVVPPEVAPADSCYNGFNIFAMTVSSPKQSYFLNYTTDFDGVDRQPHAVYRTDYTVTIPIAGQSKLDFYVIDGDHHQVANVSMTVPNLKNAQIKQPYVGNFLELEVVDVTVAR